MRLKCWEQGQGYSKCQSMLLLLLFSCVHLFVTPQTAAHHQDSLSITISKNLPKFMSTASVIPFMDHCLVVVKGLA